MAHCRIPGRCGVIEVACMTVAGAGPTDPRQVQRDGAVHLDEPAGKRARQRQRVVEPDAVQHRLRSAQAVMRASLISSWQQRRTQLGGERRGQGALAGSRPVGDEHEPAVAKLAPATNVVTQSDLRKHQLIWIEAARVLRTSAVGLPVLILWTWTT